MTKRVLTKNDPEGWYAVRFHTEGLCTIFQGALYWDGKKLRPEPGCWSNNDPDSYEVLAGPLVESPVAPEELERLRDIERLAKDYCNSCIPESTLELAKCHNALISFMKPKPPFTPPPKPPEWKRFRVMNSGFEMYACEVEGGKWLTEGGVVASSRPDSWTELDPTTGQPTGEPL